MAAQVALAVAYEGMKMMNDHVLPMIKEKMNKVEAKENTKAESSGFQPTRLHDSLNPENMGNMKPEEAQAMLGAMRSIQQIESPAETANDFTPSVPGMKGPGM